jgi:hypothetical protein
MTTHVDSVICGTFGGFRINGNPKLITIGYRPIRRPCAIGELVGRRF